MPDLQPFQRFNNRYIDEDFVNERINRNRDMAAALLSQNANTMVQSPTQGLAMLARALNARDFNRQAEREQQALSDQRAAEMGNFLQGFDPATAEFLQRAPSSMRTGLAGFAAQQALTAPEAVDNFVDLNAEEKRRLGIPETSFAQRNTADNRIRIDDAPAPPVVNVNPPELETAAEKAFGKGVGERADTRVNLSNETIAQDQDLRRIQLAVNAGAQTGLGEETLLNLKSLGNTVFGIEFTEADEQAEIIRKIGNEAALRLRNPNSGLGLTGSTSNKDLDFLKASVPNLQKTEGGIAMMVEFQLRKNQMTRDIAAEQTRVISESGGVPRDLDQRLIEFANNYEFFTPMERNVLEQMRTEGESLIERLTAPDGVSQELWDVMTPEQKALWQTSP